MTEPKGGLRESLQSKGLLPTPPFEAAVFSSTLSSLIEDSSKLHEMVRGEGPIENSDEIKEQLAALYVSLERVNYLMNVKGSFSGERNKSVFLPREVLEANPFLGELLPYNKEEH